MTFFENLMRIENSPASLGILILPAKPYRVGRFRPLPIFQASTISSRAPSSQVYKITLGLQCPVQRSAERMVRGSLETYRWFFATSRCLPWSNINVVIAFKTFGIAIIDELIFADVSLKIYMTKISDFFRSGSSLGMV